MIIPPRAAKEEAPGGNQSACTEHPGRSRTQVCFAPLPLFLSLSLAGLQTITPPPTTNSPISSFLYLNVVFNINRTN